MDQTTALLLTLGVELPVAVVVTRWRREHVSIARILGVAAVCSLLSHPFAWAANQLLPFAFWPRAMAIELGVVAVEAVGYAKLAPMSRLSAVVTSALANGLSFGAGLLWWWLGR